MFYGTISLHRIRKHNEAGTPYAWIGILSGGFIFLCVLCMAGALIALFTYAPDAMPPFIQDYQL